MMHFTACNIVLGHMLFYLLFYNLFIKTIGPKTEFWFSVLEFPLRSRDNKTYGWKTNSLGLKDFQVMIRGIRKAI